MAGYIYIMTNEHMPGLVKLGYTDRSPSERATELSNFTGVPGKWVVFHKWLLDDAYANEQRLFSALRLYKIQGEFLQLSPREAVERVSGLLAGWDVIDEAGLSSAERNAAKIVREAEANRIKEKQHEAWLKNIEMEVDSAARDARNQTQQRWKSQLHSRRLLLTNIWGIAAFLVSLTFARKIEGAFFISVIFYSFAYFMNDGKTDAYQKEEDESAERAKAAAYAKHGLDGNALMQTMQVIPPQIVPVAHVSKELKKETADKQIFTTPKEVDSQLSNATKKKWSYDSKTKILKNNHTGMEYRSGQYEHQSDGATGYQIFHGPDVWVNDWDIEFK